jgi:hypothetical protein
MQVHRKQIECKIMSLIVPNATKQQMFLSSPGAMRVHRKQIKCKIMSLVMPNTTKQQSDKLRTRSRAKELVALSIISAMQDQSNQRMPELGEEQVETVEGEKSLEREVQEQSQSNLVLNQSMGGECGHTRMFVGMRVTLMSPIILALMAMIMSIGGVDGFGWSVTSWRR